MPYLSSIEQGAMLGELNSLWLVVTRLPTTVCCDRRSIGCVSLEYSLVSLEISIDWKRFALFYECFWVVQQHTYDLAGLCSHNHSSH